MDPVQLTIIIISFILTLVVVILSIQVFFILKEMRMSLTKMNKMLDDAGKVSETVSTSITGFAGLFSGIKSGLSFLSALRKKGEVS